MVAALIGYTGDWDLAEESAQEAFALALTAWARDGVPGNPRAWLVTAARHRAVDRIRRERVGAAKLRIVAAPGFPADEVDPDEVDLDALGSGIADDRLRLIFTCCHPALGFEAQVTLALRTLCGLSTAEIARAFLVSEDAMGKRLQRTKQKIKISKIPYRVPSARLLDARIAAVLGVIYLLYNEGYAATTGPLIRHELCDSAIRLAAMVAELMPEHAEALGLHALLLLLHARAPSRVDDTGALVPLEEQDRSRWDGALAARGVAEARRALSHESVGPYQLQALIAACHVTGGPTDWGRIVRLYDQLWELVPSDTVWLNRAVAVAMRDGPSAGLELIADMAGHPLLHAVRADLYRRLGEPGEAAVHYGLAIDGTANEAERAYLARRLAQCHSAR